MTKQGLMCEHCHKAIVERSDAHLHHKIYLTDDNVNDATISLNPDNIVILHQRCHNAQHNHAPNVANHLKEVWWIDDLDVYHEHGTVTDIVIDLGRIYDCFGGLESRSKLFVMNIYQASIEQMKMRIGNWKRCFIVKKEFISEMDKQRTLNLWGAKDWNERETK
jgi:hypothetical protein